MSENQHIMAVKPESIYAQFRRIKPGTILKTLLKSIICLYSRYGYSQKQAKTKQKIKVKQKNYSDEISKILK